MFNVLQARQIPSKLVMFPDENHVSVNELAQEVDEPYVISQIIADNSAVGFEAGELADLA